MALQVNRQGIEVERLIGEAEAQLPVRSEALVPGAGRESADVLMADGYASVTGVEAQAGRVVVSGMVFCQSAYRLGQEGGARALTAQAPFEQVIEMENAAPRMSVQAGAEVEHTAASYESGHMVFMSAVSVRVRVCSLDTVEAVTGVEGVDGVQIQTGEVCSAKLNAESSAIVHLSDEVSLPAQLNARVTLMQWAEPSVERTQRDLGGVRVTGQVKVEALIASGVTSRPVALVRYALPFEQMISFPDWISGEPEAQAEVGALRLDVEEGGEGEDSTLRLACDVTVSVRMNGRDCMTVLTDVYATGDTALEGTAETVRLCAGERRMSAQETFKSTLLLPDGAPGVGTVLAVRVNPAVSGWRGQNGRTVLEGVLEATVLYMQAGEELLSSAQAELPFTLNMDGVLGEDAWVSAAAADAEATALMSDRLELRCVLRARSTERMAADAEILTGVTEHPAGKRPSGVGICYPQPGDTLWTVGRRYRLPVEALRSANGGVSEAEPGRPLLILPFRCTGA